MSTLDSTFLKLSKIVRSVLHFPINLRSNDELMVFPGSILELLLVEFERLIFVKVTAILAIKCFILHIFIIRHSMFIFNILLIVIFCWVLG
jgi:hypothetical protein